MGIFTAESAEGAGKRTIRDISYAGIAVSACIVSGIYDVPLVEVRARADLS